MKYRMVGTNVGVRVTGHEGIREAGVVATVNYFRKSSTSYPTRVTWGLKLRRALREF